MGRRVDVSKCLIKIALDGLHQIHLTQLRQMPTLGNELLFYWSQPWLSFILS